MDAIDPVWLGGSATAFAVVVFANGYRLFAEGGERRKLGQLHMLVAPTFVVMLWAVLALNGELS